MRMIMRALTIAVVTLAPASLSAAEIEGLLRMKCEWQRSTDMKTLQSETISGSTEFIYDPISDLTGTMTKEGLASPFVASTGDTLIEGIAHYSDDGAPAEQSVEINRNTGAILNMIKTAKGVRALEGVCTRISGPTFGTEAEGQ